MSGHPYALGWSPDRYRSARIAYATAKFGDDNRPLPPAWSLSAFRLRHLEQGQAGTCWVHSALQAFEVLTAAQGEYVAVPLSRMMVAYQGTLIMAGGSGRRPNPSDGGYVSAAFQAMGDPPVGAGVCHDGLWPYSDSRAALAGSPSPAATADAALNRVHQVSSLQPLGESVKRALLNGHPVGIGIWWPFGWDQQGATVFDSVGAGTFGHALTIVGWREVGGQTQWQLDNWHGLLYRPLPADEASNVPNYKPIQADRTSDFWVTDAALQRVIAKGSSELVTAAGLTGFQRREITILEGLTSCWTGF